MKTNANRTLILSSSDVQKIVKHWGLNELMDNLIARLESAFRNFSPEQTHIPVRSGFHYDWPQNGLIEWMPLHCLGEQVMIKVVGYHPANPGLSGWPTIVSTIFAYDTASGHLLGIMDGVFLTALRTGAASAVASRFLAHPDSATLGMIGCGAQVVTQLHALSRIFNLERVLIQDIDPAALYSFQKRCEPLGLEVDFVPAPVTELVTAADILVTATSIEVGEGPLFENLETRPHLHVNAVGSDFPGKVELPMDLLKQSFVCPDFPEQAMKEGECQQLSPAQIGPGIVEVAQHPEKYAHVQQQRSVFDSTGWALEDHTAMELLMEYATELGLGQEIDIEHIPEDAKNPYHFMVKVVENRRKKTANRPVVFTTP